MANILEAAAVVAGIQKEEDDDGKTHYVVTFDIIVNDNTVGGLILKLDTNATIDALKSESTIIYRQKD